MDYAEDVAAKLKDKFVRVEVDSSAESLGKKIRNAELRKIPYMLIVGEKEVENKELNVRAHKNKDQKAMSIEEFERELLDEIKERKLEKSVL